MTERLPNVLNARDSNNMFKDFELFVHEGMSMKGLMLPLVPTLELYSSYKVEILIGRIGIYEVNLNFIKWKASNPKRPSKPSTTLSMKVFVPGKTRSGHLDTGSPRLKAFANGRGDVFLNFTPFAPEMTVQRAFEMMQTDAVAFVTKLLDKAVQDGTDGYIAEANAKLHERRAQECRDFKRAATDAVLLEEDE